jgi:hypothetical protein
MGGPYGVVEGASMQVSVYLTAAATIFAVLLTVVVQVIISAIQRRNERIEDVRCSA